MFAHGEHELTRRGSPTEVRPAAIEVTLKMGEDSIQQEDTTLDSTKIIEEQPDLLNQKKLSAGSYD